MACKTIEDVLDALQAVIHSAEATSSRAGYFAALYWRVTLRVKECVAQGRFADGPRMERLDVVFANLYLDAWQDWQQQRPVTGSWRAAFEALANDRLIILQHLLVGMNAHINLDLAVAAATVAPGASIQGLEGDFQAITGILVEMIDGVQALLGRVSPLMGLLAQAAARSDDWAAYGLERSRDMAWQNALRLAALPQSQWPSAIAAMDTLVETLGRRILSPQLTTTRALLKLVRDTETASPAQVIAALTA